MATQSLSIAAKAALDAASLRRIPPIQCLLTFEALRACAA